MNSVNQTKTTVFSVQVDPMTSVYCWTDLHVSQPLGSVLYQQLLDEISENTQQYNMVTYMA